MAILTSSAAGTTCVSRMALAGVFHRLCRPSDSRLRLFSAGFTPARNFVMQNDCSDRATKIAHKSIKKQPKKKQRAREARGKSNDEVRYTPRFTVIILRANSNYGTRGRLREYFKDTSDVETPEKTTSEKLLRKKRT